jgi:nucleoid DNA-binding protein
MAHPSVIKERYGDRAVLIKDDIANEVRETLGISKREAAEMTHAFLNALTSFLAAGKSVEIRGFGSFRVMKTKDRIGKNPRTGEDVHLPSRHIMKFRTSAILKAIVAKVPVQK